MVVLGSRSAWRTTRPSWPNGRSTLLRGTCARWASSGTITTGRTTVSASAGRRRARFPRPWAHLARLRTRSSPRARRRMGPSQLSSARSVHRARSSARPSLGPRRLSTASRQTEGTWWLLPRRRRSWFAGPRRMRTRTRVRSKRRRLRRTSRTVVRRSLPRCLRCQSLLRSFADTRPRRTRSTRRISHPLRSRRISRRCHRYLQRARRPSICREG